MKSLILFSTFLLLFISTVKQASAIVDPPIFSCTSPIGVVKSNYENGTHGVPGSITTYTGSDSVYQIDDDHVLQCLCIADSADGIQSNWWKAKGLSESDISYFQRRGWVFVPEGNRWGLASDPYLVKNDSISCGSQGTGGVVFGSSKNQDDTTVGSILGVSILGATGTSAQLMLLIAVAVFSGAVTLRLARE